MHELLNFYNLDPDENLDESLRLALMFQNEVDEATRAYIEMLQLSIDPQQHNPDEVNAIVEQAIHAALITGLRAYRSWIQAQGINVTAVEAASGKDIPPPIFQRQARWPL